MDDNLLNIDDFNFIVDFIYRKAGIKFDEKKVYFVNNKIQKRINPHNA